MDDVNLLLLLLSLWLGAANDIVMLSLKFGKMEVDGSVFAFFIFLMDGMYNFLGDNDGPPGEFMKTGDAVIFLNLFM